MLRVHAFLHRSGIDVAAGVERLLHLRAQALQQVLGATAHDFVVVLAPGIARDQRGVRVVQLGRVGAVGVVERAERDDGARRRHHLADIGSPPRVPRQVAHLTRIAAIEPLVEEPQLREGLGRRDAAQVEPRLPSKRLHVVRDQHFVTQSVTGFRPRQANPPWLPKPIRYPPRRRRSAHRCRRQRAHH